MNGTIYNIFSTFLIVFININYFLELYYYILNKYLYIKLKKNYYIKTINKILLKFSNQLINISFNFF